MRVEVLENFYDVQMKTLHSKGDIIDITKERAAQIRTVLSGYIRIVEVQKEAEIDFNEMTKKELIAYAKINGITIDQRMSKAQIIDELGG